jgi:RHS repeat-associated protein
VEVEGYDASKVLVMTCHVKQKGRPPRGGVDKGLRGPLASGKRFPANVLKLLSLVFLLASAPAAAQVCNTEKGTVTGTIKVDDGSKPPCDFIDLWAIPESGAWVELGKVAWGEAAAQVPAGTWRFATHACGTYVPFRPSAPVRCAKDAQGCVVCNGRFEISQYALFGGFSGQVTLLPEDQPAGQGVPVSVATGLNCGADKFAHTDEKGRFDLGPEIEPHRSNHWGLPVDGDGSHRGSRTYFLNADYCDNGVTATTYSSTDVAVNLFRVSSYMAAQDPSIRPLVPPPLFPAMPPHEAGPGISITTGNVALDQIDAAAWGGAGRLLFRRSYNSRLAGQPRLTVLGAGWTHSYAAQIDFPVPGVLRLHEDDGAPRYFQDIDGDGTYKPSAPVTEPSRFTKAAGGYARRFADGALEDYDERGRLRRRVDARGRATTLTRDSADRLVTITDPDGRKLSLAYDAEENLRSLSMGDEILARYSIDDDGRLRAVTYAEGNGFTFTYDELGQLLAVADAGGRTLRTYTYEGARAKTFEIAGGRERVSLEYSPLKTVVTDVLGRVTTYEWSNIRGLRVVTAAIGRCPGCAPAVVDPLDPTPALPEPPVPVPALDEAVPTWVRLLSPPWPLASWPIAPAVEWPRPEARVSERHAWTYDLQGRLLSHRDADGAATHVAYDGNGLPSSVTDGLGRVVRFTRDTAGRITAATAPSVANPRQERSSTFSYDAQGRLAARTENGVAGDGTPIRLATRLGYDEQGRLVRVDGPRPDVADVAAFAYDATGNLVSAAAVDWLPRRLAEHTRLGWPRRVTEASGRVLAYAYAPGGRVAGVHEGEDVTLYEYTSTGRVKRVQRPRGNGVAYTYDAYDRLVETRNAAEHRFLYTYDMAGQRTRDQARTATGGERDRAFEYDRLGRLSRILVADGRYELTHDAPGRVVSFRRPGGDPETYQYDEAGRLTLQRIPGGPATLYRYDARDSLVSAADADGSTYTYTHDDFGRLTRMVAPSGATTTFGYNAAGQLATRTDGRGVTTTFERDALGRVTAVRTPNDRGTVLAYDTCPQGRGKLCDVTDRTGRTTFAYTPRGQLLEETRRMGTASFTTAYSYDRNGNVNSLRYPSGRVVTYSWDEADHPRSVSTAATGPMQVVANLSYGADGALGGISYANGVSLTFGRDAQGRVRTIRGAPFDLAYAYDPQGDVTGVSGGDRTQAFGYNPARRLGSASGPWGAFTWTYDAAGNRVSEAGPDGTMSYAYQARTQRLLSVTGTATTAVGHDAAGRAVRAGTERFVYDDLGQLVMVGAAHRTGEYGYDYKGRRAWKNAKGSTVVFVYDAQDRLIAEATREGAVLAEYVYDGDRPIARAQRGALTYVHVDPMGRPIAISDAKGQRVWSPAARPFGDRAASAAATPRPSPTSTPVPPAFHLRAGGQYFDEETGLVHNHWRTFDPQLGRYLEPNPCARPGRILHHNVYAYVGQNPLSFVARRGLVAVPAAREWAIPGDLWESLLPSPGGVSPECQVLASLP